jgi:amidase
MESCHSYQNDVLKDYDAVELVELIKSGEISLSDASAAVIARLNQVNPTLNALARPLELGLGGANEKGYFSGLPILIKDTSRVKDTISTDSSKAFTKPQISKESDAMVDQIRGVGFNYIGKTSMPEFGFTCTTEFENDAPTRNPWNTDYNCGGSSGGSAALVAAGVLPIAHSADGGGSTRIPASCCGLVGLKPTRGRLLKSGKFEKQLVDIAIDGVVTRSVRDTIKFYTEAEKFFRNSKLPEIGEAISANKEKKIFGYSYDPVTGSSEQEVRNALKEVLADLEKAGHTVKEVQMPVTNQLVEDFQNLWAMNAFMIKRFGKFLFKQPFDPKLLSPLTKGLSKHYAKQAHKTGGFIKRLKAADKIYKEFLKETKIDFFITPTIAGLPPKNGVFDVNKSFPELFDKMTEWAGFTPIANATGTPAITLPLKHNEEHNLPIGIMFWGNHGDEKGLLEVALEMEEMFPFRKMSI